MVVLDIVLLELFLDIIQMDLGEVITFLVDCWGE